jgi:hypothetical protein
MTPRPRIYSSARPNVGFGAILNPPKPERLASAVKASKKGKAVIKADQTYAELIQFPEDEDL